MGDARPGLDETPELSIGEMHRMCEHGPLPESAGAVVDVDIIGRLGEQPGDFGDLATVLGQMRLPVRAGARRERSGLAQELGRARDGESRCDGVLEAAVVGAVPSIDQAGGFRQALVQDHLGIDGGVVGPPVHHHLAHDGPNPVRLGRAERGIQARLVDRAVDQGRRRARAREGAPRGGSEPLGRGFIEVTLEREDVPLEPRQQVEPGAETGVRELGQVGVEVDHAWEQDPWPQVDGCGHLPRASTGGSGEGDPTRAVNDQEPVGLVRRATVVEGRQQAAAERERRAQGQVHARQAIRRSRSLDRSGDPPGRSRPPDRPVSQPGRPRSPDRPGVPPGRSRSPDRPGVPARPLARRSPGEHRLRVEEGLGRTALLGRGRPAIGEFHRVNVARALTANRTGGPGRTGGVFTG